jgi:aminoethylphosphonate catabolism LysR family transcriptional regulator
MNVTQLRSFNAVALSGSFAGAAKRLRRSQPTLSRQVSDLELSYGVELFHRRGRTIELSAIGKKLLPITERLFSNSDQAQELLKTASGLEIGHLRISAVNPIDIISIISAFSREYPSVTMSLTICNSEQALNSLFNIRADVAMLAAENIDNRIRYIKFGSRPLVAYVSTANALSKKNAIDFHEIADQPVVIRERGSRTRKLFDEACNQAGFMPKVAKEINNRDAFRESIAQGLGIGIIGDNGLIEDQRLKKIELRDCDVVMERQIAHLQDRADSRLIQAFMNVSQKVASSDISRVFG